MSAGEQITVPIDVTGLSKSRCNKAVQGYTVKPGQLNRQETRCRFVDATNLDLMCMMFPIEAG